MYVKYLHKCPKESTHRYISTDYPKKNCLRTHRPQTIDDARATRFIKSGQNQPTNVKTSLNCGFNNACIDTLSVQLWRYIGIYCHVSLHFPRTRIVIQ